MIALVNGRLPAPGAAPGGLPAVRNAQHGAPDLSTGADVLLLGDSITESYLGSNLLRSCPRCKGVPEALAEELREWRRPLPIAISGDQTQHLLWRLQHGEMPAQLREGGAVINLHIGTNNIGHGMRGSQAAAGVRAVAQWLLANTKSPVSAGHRRHSARPLLSNRGSAHASSRRCRRAPARGSHALTSAAPPAPGCARAACAQVLVNKLLPRGNGAHAARFCPPACLPDGSAPTSYAPAIAEANALIGQYAADLAARYPGRVGVADCGRVFLTEPGTAGNARGSPSSAFGPQAAVRRELMPDFLHPNEMGHRLLLRCLRPKLLALQAQRPSDDAAARIEPR